MRSDNAFRCLHPQQDLSFGPPHQCATCLSPWHPECDTCGAADHACVKVRVYYRARRARLAAGQRYAELVAW